MPKMTFKKIGTGIDQKTKTGKPAIQLTLDRDAQKLIENHDFEHGIWLFKNTNDKGSEYYSVMCPMPETYQVSYDNLAKNWAKKFEKKHATQNSTQFREWTEK